MPASVHLYFQRCLKIEINMWRRTLLEVIIMYSMVFMICLNPIAHSDYMGASNSFEESRKFDLNKLNSVNIFRDLIESKRDKSEYSLAYAPICVICTRLAESVAHTLNLNGTLGYENELKLQTEFDDRLMLAGIVFHGVEGNKVPRKLTITLRYPSYFRTLRPHRVEDKLWVTRCSGTILQRRDHIFDNYINTDIYLREGFAQIQHQLFLEWFRHLRKVEQTNYNEPMVELRTIQRKITEEICPISNISSIPMILMHFLFLFPFLNLIWNQAQQFEDNVQVHEWYNGFKFRTQWLIKFFVAFLHLMLISLVAVITIYIVWVITDRGQFVFLHFTLLLLFVQLYIAALVVFGLVISNVVANKLNAVLIGLIIWVINYALFSILLDRYWDIHGLYVVSTFLIFINNLFPFGMHLFYHMINQQKDITERDLAIIYLSGTGFLMIYIIVLFFVQIVRPGFYLSSKVTKINKFNPTKKDIEKTVVIVSRQPNWHNFQFGGVDSEEMVRIRNVSTYHQTSERKILKNVSLRLYKDEIFVLLGHIGSGKLTLMRVLCGLKLARRGSVEIGGKAIYDNLYEARKSIDFRMEQNGLPDYLTVQEVIKYYVMTKLNVNDSAVMQFECTKWWEYLEPHIKSEHMLVGSLNDGQKRLISLCCALAGGTKIIALNEPTRFLNASYSNIYWEILSQERGNRAIFVTLTSITEAELIAHRVGILNIGVLEASGTPFFLRSKFGTGLELILIKKAHIPGEPITDFLKEFIPEIEPENEIGDQLIYRIVEENRPILQQLLIHLENERKILGIDNIRVIGPDLSDIYMHLVTSFRLKQQTIPDFTQTFQYSVMSNYKRRKQQMRAMLYKKLIHQAPSIWPIIMCFASFVLIVLISRLAFVLDVPLDRENKINLGFNDGAETRSIIPNPVDCGFIELVSANKGQTYFRKNEQSRLFDASSFQCRKGEYGSYLREHGNRRLGGMGAVEIKNKENLVGWTSQGVFHSASMIINLMHNTILELAYPNNKKIITTIVNHPMPTPFSLKISLLDNQITHINQPLTIGAVLPFTISIFIIPLVEEKSRHLRVLQILAGISLDIYWLISFLWDYFTYLIYTTFIITVMSLMEVDGIDIKDKLVIFALMCDFGFAAILLTYFLSLFFEDEIYRAFIMSFLLQIISGLFLFVMYWELANTNTVFYYVACMSPGFALLDGISTVYTQSKEQRICRVKCFKHPSCNNDNIYIVMPQCRFDTFFKWKYPGILTNFCCMSIASLVFIVSIFWVELHRRESKFLCSKKLHTLRTACYPFDDADVADIKMKIADADMHKCKQSAFFVDQLEAKLPRSSTKVDTISFAVNKYTNMGIFGTRKSGKSHLVRQLIGEDGFCFGEIYARGLDFKYDLDKVRTYIGYCPQNWGYLDSFTPNELIRLMSMINGVPEEKIGDIIYNLSIMLNMSGWMNRRIESLTADKRRKVSIGISMVAYNKILILDEPTYGLPATARREIWNLIRYIRFCGKTIIFTSTEELECKVLADFIILYQNSEMLAIGSLQYLRHKYSHGFYLEVSLIRDGNTIELVESNLRKDIDNLTRYVGFLHDNSELVAIRGNWLKFYVPVDNILYSHLYGSLEKNRIRLNILDYAIYQTTTENILNYIINQRNELKRREMSMSTCTISSHNSHGSSDSQLSNASGVSPMLYMYQETSKSASSEQ